MLISINTMPSAKNWLLHFYCFYHTGLKCTITINVVLIVQWNCVCRLIIFFFGYRSIFWIQNIRFLSLFVIFSITWLLLFVTQIKFYFVFVKNLIYSTKQFYYNDFWPFFNGRTAILYFVLLLNILECTLLWSTWAVILKMCFAYPRSPLIDVNWSAGSYWMYLKKSFGNQHDN